MVLAFLTAALTALRVDDDERANWKAQCHRLRLHMQTAPEKFLCHEVGALTLLPKLEPQVQDLCSMNVIIYHSSRTRSCQYKESPSQTSVPGPIDSDYTGSRAERAAECWLLLEVVKTRGIACRSNHHPCSNEWLPITVSRSDTDVRAYTSSVPT